MLGYFVKNLKSKCDIIDYHRSFFLSGFSCTNIHDLRDRRRRERLFIYLLSVTFSSLLLHKHSDINKTIRSVFVTTNTFGRILFGMLGFWSKFHLSSIFESRLIVWQTFWKAGKVLFKFLPTVRAVLSESTQIRNVDI